MMENTSNDDGLSIDPSPHIFTGGSCNSNCGDIFGRDGFCSSPSCPKNINMRPTFPMSTTHDSVTVTGRGDHYHMDFMLEANRLASFINWPMDASISPAEMAHAGLYYTGRSDRVQCAGCRWSLGNWERGHIAFSDHSMHFPECSFLAEKIKKAIITDTATSAENIHQTEVTNFNNMEDLPAVQIVKQLGFEMEAIKNAIQKIHHDEKISAVKLLDILWENETDSSLEGATGGQELHVTPPGTNARGGTNDTVIATGREPADQTRQADEVYCFLRRNANAQPSRREHQVAESTSDYCSDVSRPEHLEDTPDEDRIRNQTTMDRAGNAQQLELHSSPQI